MTYMIALLHRRSNIIAMATLLMLPACAAQEQAAPKAHEIGARIVLSAPTDRVHALGRIQRQRGDAPALLDQQLAHVVLLRIIAWFAVYPGSFSKRSTRSGASSSPSVCRPRKRRAAIRQPWPVRTSSSS